jgi:hypothetical protein
MTHLCQLTRPERDRIISVHEAAHAVTALHFGWPVKFLTITPTADADGCCRFEAPPATSLHDMYWRLAVRYAGYAAEQRLAVETCDCNRRDDEQVIAKTLSKYFPGDPQAQARVRCKAFTIAAQVVSRRWNCVSWLAGGLMLWRTISTYDALRYLLKSQPECACLPLPALL